MNCNLVLKIEMKKKKLDKMHKLEAEVFYYVHILEARSPFAAHAQEYKQKRRAGYIYSGQEFIVQLIFSV